MCLFKLKTSSCLRRGILVETKIRCHDGSSLFGKLIVNECVSWLITVVHPALSQYATSPYAVSIRESLKLAVGIFCSFSRRCRDSPMC